MQDHLILVAGGVGDRMGSSVPKQFLELNGKPVIMHTIDRFLSYNQQIQIVLVLNSGYFDHWKELCDHCSFKSQVKLVSGGEQRFHSVKNGLNAIDDSYGIVGVHDAVRPLVSPETIEACFEGARVKGSAVPVVEVVDSLRVVAKDDSQMVDRNRFRIVQTPQCFELSLLKKAYRLEYRPSFTDSASVIEALGEPVNLVQGNRENIKLTTPADMSMASSIIDDLNY